MRSSGAWVGGVGEGRPAAGSSYQAVAALADRHRLNYLHEAQPPLALFPGPNEPAMPPARQLSACPRCAASSGVEADPMQQPGSSDGWPAAFAPTDEAWLAAGPAAATAATAHGRHYLPRAHAHEPSATADIATMFRGQSATRSDSAEAAAHLLSLKIAARVAAQVCAQMAIGCGVAPSSQIGSGGAGACTGGGLPAGVTVAERGETGFHTGIHTGLETGIHTGLPLDELELILGCEIQAELAPLLRQLGAERDT